MTGQHSHRQVWLLIAVLLAAPGCDGPSDSAGPGAAGAPAGAGTRSAAEAGRFTGRVALVDGSPITLPGVKYAVTINGVTAVGERNSFSPKVGPDGTFKLELPPGMFYPPFGTITFPFEGKNYVAPLEPLDPVEETRDGAEGIVQNFAWRLTGPKASVLNPDPANATHWYGISIPVLRSIYREDTKAPQTPPSDGTRITWTLTPTSKRIDGADAVPVTMERSTGPNAPVSDALHDLPPANYEVSAVATLPDGSTQRVLVLAAASGAYQPTANVILEPYSNSGEMVTMRVYWVLE